jgi:hypothetical protein
MHICPVTRDKVEHPAAEIVRSKEMNIPFLRRHHFIEIYEIHKDTSHCSCFSNLISIARQIATRRLSNSILAGAAGRLYLTARTFLTYLQIIA